MGDSVKLLLVDCPTEHSLWPLTAGFASCRIEGVSVLRCCVSNLPSKGRTWSQDSKNGRWAITPWSAVQGSHKLAWQENPQGDSMQENRSSLSSPLLERNF